MSTDQDSIHRKEILPWYESASTHAAFAVMMFLVFIFGTLGIIEAYDTIIYIDYVWVPVLLMFMSGVMLIAAVIRLVRKYIHQAEDVYFVEFRQNRLTDY